MNDTKVNSDFSDKELVPLFFDSSVLPKPKHIFRRHNEKGYRKYYYIDPELLTVVQKPSVTSIINAVMPTPQFLMKWYAEMGYYQAQQKVKESADYGTLWHILASQFTTNRRFSFNTLDNQINEFKASRYISYHTPYWADNIKKDLLAWQVFCRKHELNVLAIGIMLDSSYGFAGEIDLVAEISIGTGANGEILANDRRYNKVTRCLALIDWKTGRHGFSEHNEAQLHMYKLMWNENFPTVPVTHVFNWSPKEWKETPDYNFKCQTASITQFTIPFYIQIFKLNQQYEKPHTYVDINGELNMDEDFTGLHVETWEQRYQRFVGVKAKLEDDNKSFVDFMATTTEDNNSIPVDSDIAIQKTARLIDAQLAPDAKQNTKKIRIRKDAQDSIKEVKSMSYPKDEEHETANAPEPEQSNIYPITANAEPIELEPAEQDSNAEIVEATQENIDEKKNSNALPYEAYKVPPAVQEILDSANSVLSKLG